ncbi:MAG: hypothetical protein K8R63_08265 [Bacteroidales bacterium]|nr:hypothetical protein [Bacteroidales bacterium]
MEQAKDLVSRINEQVLELLGQHRILKSKSTELQTRNTELLKQIENQIKEIDQFKEQIVKLKITRSITDKKGSTEVNTKIEELLREIDKCVGLLNQ